ncbi:hypothetical protein LJK88_08175 [Paenibacillus sp. P26]|nr:hypothetical protein LJK88_08175 [Paenibacillus sp. P26]
MRIIRFLNESKVPVLVALTDENEVYELPFTDFMELIRTAEDQQVAPSALAERFIQDAIPVNVSFEHQLLVPIEAPEVWAAGVTYEKSKDARNHESGGGKPEAVTCYDKVYDAPRPEIFFKSTAARTVGPKGPVYLRSDSNWQIPEPELGLVIDRNGKILGYTIGNDMSSRDIEGENPLYLPRRKYGGIPAPSAPPSAWRKRSAIRTASALHAGFSAAAARWWKAPQARAS